MNWSKLDKDLQAKLSEDVSCFLPTSHKYYVFLTTEDDKIVLGHFSAPTISELSQASWIKNIRLGRTTDLRSEEPMEI